MTSSAELPVPGMQTAPGSAPLLAARGLEDCSRDGLPQTVGVGEPSQAQPLFLMGSSNGEVNFNRDFIKADKLTELGAHTVPGDLDRKSGADIPWYGVGHQSLR